MAPLSVDSRRPDTSKAVERRKQDGNTGGYEPDLNATSRVKASFSSNRKVSVDIFRDDDSGTEGPKTGMRMENPNQTRDKARRPLPSAASNMSNTIPNSPLGPAVNTAKIYGEAGYTAKTLKSDGKGGHTVPTESRSNTSSANTTQRTFKDEKDRARQTVASVAAPFDGHVASPTAGRVSRGVGTRGDSGSAAVPGGIHRLSSMPIRPKKTAQLYLSSADYSVNSRSTTVGGYAPKPQEPQESGYRFSKEPDAKRQNPTGIDRRAARSPHRPEPSRQSSGRRHPAPGGDANK
jgi:hypothetical protein